MVKTPPANAGDPLRCLILEYGRFPWRRKWQPAPVFLSGECHRQRSPEGYSPQGCKELNMTENMHTLVVCGQHNMAKSVDAEKWKDMN